MSGVNKITGEGKISTLESFIRGSSPDPFNPRLLYLIENLDKEKINAIMNRMNRGEITGEEMIKLLEEVTDACVPPEEEEVDMEEDEGRDEVEEDREMGKMLQLGDQEKPGGIVKRPQPSLVQSELESKKPRVAQGLGFQREQPVAAEM